MIHSHVGIFACGENEKGVRHILSNLNKCQTCAEYEQAVMFFCTHLHLFFKVIGVL